MEKITSLQNPIVKKAIRLREKSRERETERLFFVEGMMEFSRALDSQLRISAVFFVEDCLRDDDLEKSPWLSMPKSFCVSGLVFEKLAMRGRHSKVCALFEMPVPLELFRYVNPVLDPVVFLLESPEKPGNLGAVCRSIDGAGFSKVLTTGKAVDIWNPQAIRSSVGSVFRILPVWSENEEAYTVLKKLGYQFHGLLPLASHSFYDEGDGVSACLNVIKEKPLVFVFGEESQGVSEWWQQRLDRSWSLPMLGMADSLNLSVSAALVAYEMRRLLVRAELG